MTTHDITIYYDDETGRWTLQAPDTLSRREAWKLLQAVTTEVGPHERPAAQ